MCGTITILDPRAAVCIRLALPHRESSDMIARTGHGLARLPRAALQRPNITGRETVVEGLRGRDAGHVRAGAGG